MPKWSLKMAWYWRRPLEIPGWVWGKWQRVICPADVCFIWQCDACQNLECLPRFIVKQKQHPQKSERKLTASALVCRGFPLKICPFFYCPIKISVLFNLLFAWIIVKQLLLTQSDASDITVPPHPPTPQKTKKLPKNVSINTSSTCTNNTYVD